MSKVHLFQDRESWEVWLDTGIDERDGLCIGYSELSRKDCISEAIADLEAALVKLRKLMGK